MLKTVDTIGFFALCAVAFASFCIGLKYRRRHRELAHLYIYPLSSCVQVVSYFLFTNFNTVYRSSQYLAVALSVHIFVIIETICLLLFFYRAPLLPKALKRVLGCTYPALALIYLLSLFTAHRFNINYLLYLQSVITLIPCFTYLYNLLLYPLANPIQQPSLWFCLGLLVYHTSTMPMFFMLSYFTCSAMPELFDLINITGYCILFIFLIKGYRCKPKISL